jgi:hypothetical protein
MVVQSRADDSAHAFIVRGRRKRYRLSLVADELNQRYGQIAVYFGGIHSVLDSAPTRISFTSIPDVDDF